MTRLPHVLGTAFAVSLVAGGAQAEPAIIFDLGGKFDASFNEAAFRGAERWAEETGESYREIELSSEAQREQALRRMAESGSNPVVTVGFAYASTMEQLAPEYPDTDFVVIDALVEQPNVRNYVFSEHEGSFLVGMLAALKSETGTVGFVGGMDIPLIRKFACGYAQGAEYVDADIEIIQNMIGTTPAAWSDTTAASEITRSQINQGADVIYHAAGGSGIGVLQTAADEGVYGIGVDSNQNGLEGAAGSVLTSMVKRVDNAVYESFMDSGETFDTENRVMDLESEGVDYAVDEHNRDLLTDEMIEQVEQAKSEIIAGEIDVHDYTTDESCPAG